MTNKMNVHWINTIVCSIFQIGFNSEYRSQFDYKMNAGEPVNNVDPGFKY